MRQARLNDAAITLGRILDPQGVQFGIFGGGAIAMLGGPRASKDLDVIVVQIQKDTLVRMIDGRGGFRFLNNSRNDVAIFIWNDRNDSEGVTVSCLLVRPSQAIQVHGETQGTGATQLLDPVYLFKGKLRAAATRNKHSDAADIVWLEGKYGDILKQHVREYDLVICGLALKRYIHLYRFLERIGIDVRRAVEAAKDISLDRAGGVQLYDVQRGLLA